MSAQERLRRALDTIEAAAREQRDRRELTERRLAETETKARAAFQKEVDSAVRYADHMEELNKRKKEAGGWATGKTPSADDHVIGFVGDEDEQPHQDPSAPFPGTNERTRPTPARPGRDSRPDGFDDEDFSNNSWLD